MKTKVVNLRRDQFDVYIGRAGKGQDGYFGNPIVVGRPCPECGEVHARDFRLLNCYRSLADARVRSDAEFARRVVELHGKVLGCFCKPGPCHGDILAEIADREAKRDRDMGPGRWAKR